MGRMLDACFSESFIESFNSKRIKGSSNKDCWSWSGATDKDNYGVTTYKDRSYKAHRIAFFLQNGEEPIVVRHSCDVAERMADLRGWTRHSSGSYWCLHCNATGDAPGDQDCSNCGGLGWRGPPPTYRSPRSSRDAW